MKTFLIFLILAVGACGQSSAQSKWFNSYFPAPASGAAITQTCLNHNVATSVTCTSGTATNITATHAIIIIIAGVGQNSGTFTVNSVTACGGDVVTQDANSPIGSPFANGMAALYYVQSSNGGCDSVSVNVTVNGINAALAWIEYSSGVAARDASNGSSGTSTAPSGGAVTCANSNDIVVSFYGTSTNAGTITQPAGFTTLGAVAGQGYAIAYESGANCTGGVTPTWSITSSVNWQAMNAAYK